MSDLADDLDNLTADARKAKAREVTERITEIRQTAEEFTSSCDDLIGAMDEWEGAEKDEAASAREEFEHFAGDVRLALLELMEMLK